MVEARATENKSLLPILEAPNGPFPGTLFMGLYGTKPDGSLVPVLAQDLPQISADGMTYTVNMRKEAKWSDGAPLTADDVVYTYQLMFDPMYKAVPSFRRADLEGILADIQATDPYTVVMKTKRPSASFLPNQLRDGLVPKHIMGEVAPEAFATNPFSTAPSVASGPFKFQEWKTGDHVTGVRNDAYFRGPPNLDTYVVKLVTDPNSAITQVVTGEVDYFLATGTFSRYDEMIATPNRSTYLVTVGQGPRIWYNLDPAAPASKIFADKLVRQALRYAANVEGMNSAVLFNYGALPSSSGVFPPYWWPNNPDGQPAYTFDKAKAEALLDQAGWTRGSSGIREKAGAPLKFELMTSSDNVTWQSIATVLQQNWRDVGVDVNLRVLRFAQLITASLDRDFDVLMQSSPYSQSGNPDPDPAEAFHSRTAIKGGRNYSNYKNPQVDSLLDQAVGTLDQAQRKQLYFQLQDILNDEVPSFNTPFWKYLAFINKRVVNMGVERIGPLTGYTRYFMNETWVTDGK
jgi:peptide/nickel transport system substrate-binding protein